MKKSGSEIIEQVLSELNIKAPTFSANIGVEYQRINDIQRKKTKKISGDLAGAIMEKYPQFNLSWLLTGEGDMLKEPDTHTSIKMNTEKKERNLIPFYDNVITVGGLVSRTADVDTAHFEPSEYIDTGDWFRDATAAIRHYEDSMDEYPPGCILALKEVKDWELVVPGRDYLIETSEYRITKRLQRGKTPEYITAYSTSKETYPDGRMIHEPFDIPWSSIRRISLVLGYVVKKNGGTIVFNNNK